MIDCNAVVSALPQECQMTTELPAGGGDNGGRGGISVGVVWGVPNPWEGVVVGKIVPAVGALAVTDLLGV